MSTAKRSPLESVLSLARTSLVPFLTLQEVVRLLATARQLREDVELAKFLLATRSETRHLFQHCIKDPCAMPPTYSWEEEYECTGEDHDPSLWGLDASPWTPTRPDAYARLLSVAGMMATCIIPHCYVYREGLHPWHMLPFILPLEMDGEITEEKLQEALDGVHEGLGEAFGSKEPCISDAEFHWDNMEVVTTTASTDVKVDCKYCGLCRRITDEWLKDEDAYLSEDKQAATRERLRRKWEEAGVDGDELDAKIEGDLDEWNRDWAIVVGDQDVPGAARLLHDAGALPMLPPMLGTLATTNASYEDQVFEAMREEYPADVCPRAWQPIRRAFHVNGLGHVRRVDMPFCEAHEISDSELSHFALTGGVTPGGGFLVGVYLVQLLLS